MKKKAKDEKLYFVVCYNSDHAKELMRKFIKALTLTSEITSVSPTFRTVKTKDNEVYKFIGKSSVNEMTRGTKGEIIYDETFEKMIDNWHPSIVSVISAKINDIFAKVFSIVKKKM